MVVPARANATQCAVAAPISSSAVLTSTAALFTSSVMIHSGCVRLHAPPELKNRARRSEKAR
jgi:hypothetical protein